MRLTVCAIVAACAVMAAQEPQQPVFRSRVDSISVNATVTDKQGKPVTDLKPEDFEIKESGKVQTIESFKFIETPISEARGLEPPRPILSMQEMARETANPQNRLFIVFLDDYHTRESNSMFIRKELAKWVEGLTSYDLVALLYPWQSALAATFSRDHDGTAAAILKFTGRKYNYRAKSADEARYAYLPAEQQEQLRNDQTMRTLQSACSLLATLREGRKTLLYVSEGMFATLPAGVRTISDFAPPITPGTNQKTGQQSSFEYFRSSDLLLRMRNFFQVAARGNTVIYTLDPRGLAVSEFSAADSVGADADRQVLAESIDSLRIIADETDGRAIVGRNNPLPDLQKMVEEVSAYYLLAYTSTLAPRDGKFHPIDVKVNRRDVEIRARKGYWAYTEDEIRRASEPPKPGPPAEVAAAMDALANNVEPTSKRDVLLWLGAARGETEKAKVTLVWEVPPGIQSTGADQLDKISVVATSGRDVVFKGDVPRDPAALRPGGRITFDAPAGPLYLRVATLNARGLVLETSDLSDFIPDYSSPGPTITAPAMYRGRTPFDIATIRKAASPVPSATRLFSRTERLLVRFDVYGADGQPLQVTMRVLTRAGVPLNDLPAPTLLTGHTFEADINLMNFNPPGDFILEITATAGTEKVVRLVGIRVKS